MALSTHLRHRKGNMEGFLQDPLENEEIHQRHQTICEDQYCNGIHALAMITNNSNISFTPFRSRRLDFIHRYMDPELFKVLGVLSLFLHESDSKDSLARRHLKNTFISHAPPFEVALILIELHLRINDKFCKIGHAIFARSAKYGSAWDIPCAATRIHFNFLAL